MTPFQAILLGGLQGLTEFLPVSSSGHLVLAQNFIPGFSQPGILFDVIVHLGTVVSVVVYFVRQVLRLDRKAIINILIASIPAGVFGFIFRNPLASLFSDTATVGLALIITGILNIVVNFYPKKSGLVKPFSSFTIGIAQAIAIIPGISRSGSTIFAGVVQGISRREAAIFSFLISVPAVLGAVSLELFSNMNLLYTIEPSSYVLGFTASLVVGYISIRMVFLALTSNIYYLFGIYCIALGAVDLLLL